MGYMKEKVAYLRGLADGMEIGGDAQGKLLLAMIETMDEMAGTIDENEEAIIDLDECIDDICDELSDIDECLDALIDDDDECDCCCDDFDDDLLMDDDDSEYIAAQYVEHADEPLADEDTSSDEDDAE